MEPICIVSPIVRNTVKQTLIDIFDYKLNLNSFHIILNYVVADTPLARC
jgi:hypothetical protein